MTNEIIIKTKDKIVKIGENNPCFIIAEMSGNHGHDINKALQLIDEAAKSGVDAIKLQTYTPDTITMDCDNEDFIVKVNDAWSGQTLHDLYKKAYTPWEWHKELKEYTESKGLIFFSTPFDETAVDFLEELKVDLYKVASFEITHIPLLKKIAKTGKPVIMSRGMASKEEIALAIKTLKENGCNQICLLHCVSSYPAKPEEMNLKTISDIKERFNVIPGLSDHTLGMITPLTSISLGAKIIEKHFTLKRSDGGPDAGFSLEPNELVELVKSVRESEAAIGTVFYGTGKGESENKTFRRSIYISKDINKGELLSEKNIRVIRPGFGLEPKYFEEVLGKKTNRDLKKGTALKREFIENE